MKSLIVFLLLISSQLYSQKPENTLPVELVYFEGYFADGKVILFWGTATEVNNYGFEVERRMPQTSWINVGFVFGWGNSNSPKSYFFEDSTDILESIYFYRLKQIDNDGQSKYSDTIEISTVTKLERDVPPLATFSLEQNYPNPFNPSTIISYRTAPLNLPDKSGETSLWVTLEVFDILGHEVATLVNEEQSPGNYSVKFDATNNLQLTTNPLPSGVYFYQLRAGKFVETKKFILTK